MREVKPEWPVQGSGPQATDIKPGLVGGAVAPGYPSNVGVQLQHRTRNLPPPRRCPWELPFTWGSHYQHVTMTFLELLTRLAPCTKCFTWIISAQSEITVLSVLDTLTGAPPEWAPSVQQGPGTRTVQGQGSCPLRVTAGGDAEEAWWAPRSVTAAAQGCRTSRGWGWGWGAVPSPLGGGGPFSFTATPHTNGASCSAGGSSPPGGRGPLPWDPRDWPFHRLCQWVRREAPFWGQGVLGPQPGSSHSSGPLGLALSHRAPDVLGRWPEEGRGSVLKTHTLNEGHLFPCLPSSCPVSGLLLFGPQSQHPTLPRASCGWGPRPVPPPPSRRGLRVQGGPLHGAHSPQAALLRTGPLRVAFEQSCPPTLPTQPHTDG